MLHSAHMVDGGRPAGRKMLGALLLAAIAIAAGYALRVFAIEPPEPAWACQSLDPPWWCPLRMGGILALRWGALGIAALILGVHALWRDSQASALLALAVGGAGLVLYVPEPAAGGLLLGALVLLRR